MGQPVLAFLQDELGFSRQRAAWMFGALTLLLGFVCLWLYPGGSFDEFDFWSGTFALVVFALLESVVFAWVFGMDRGWAEITRGAQLRVPVIFRWVIRWVTPSFILLVFLGALIEPAGGDWAAAVRALLHGGGWPFAAESVIGRVLHLDMADPRWIDDAGRATPVMVKDATRLLLLALFGACAWAVHRAWRGRDEDR
jgi:hypothetical protein